MDKQDDGGSGHGRDGLRQDRPGQDKPGQDGLGQNGPGQDSGIQPGTDADFSLPEPQLGTAEISRDVAETTALNEVEAEAAQVAQEAERAGTLAGGDQLRTPGMPSSSAVHAAEQAADLAAAKAGGHTASGAYAQPAEHVPAVESNPTDNPAPAGPIPAGGQGQTPAGAQAMIDVAASQGRNDVPVTSAAAEAAGPSAAEVRTRAERKAQSRKTTQAWTPTPSSGAQQPQHTPAGPNKPVLVIGAIVVALILVGLVIWLVVTLVGVTKSTAAAGHPATSASATSALAISALPLPPGSSAPPRP